MARPPKYNETYVQLAYWMAHAALTEEQMAAQFGVDRRTLLRWKKTHPDFADALERGKETPDDLVEAALYQRAIGYTFTEERVTHQGDVVHVELERPPDTVACIFWLKNRRPKEWRDVHKVETTATVTVEITEAAKQIHENPEALEHARAAFRTIKGNGSRYPGRNVEAGCPN